MEYDGLNKDNVYSLSAGTYRSSYGYIKGTIVLTLDELRFKSAPFYPAEEWACPLEEIVRIQFLSQFTAGDFSPYGIPNIPGGSAALRYQGLFLSVQYNTFDRIVTKDVVVYETQQRFIYETQPRFMAMLKTRLGKRVIELPPKDATSLTSNE